MTKFESSNLCDSFSSASSSCSETRPWLASRRGRFRGPARSVRTWTSISILQTPGEAGRTARPCTSNGFGTFGVWGRPAGGSRCAARPDRECAAGRGRSFEAGRALLRESCSLVEVWIIIQILSIQMYTSIEDTYTAFMISYAILTRSQDGKRKSKKRKLRHWKRKINSFPKKHNNQLESWNNFFLPLLKNALKTSEGVLWLVIGNISFVSFQLC